MASSGGILVSIYTVFAWFIIFCLVFIVPLAICFVINFFILRSLKGKARIFLDTHKVLNVIIHIVLSFVLLIIGLLLFNLYSSFTFYRT